MYPKPPVCHDLTQHGEHALRAPKYPMACAHTLHLLFLTFHDFSLNLIEVLQQGGISATLLERGATPPLFSSRHCSPTRIQVARISG